MKKKIISSILSLTMLLSLLPVSAFAAGPTAKAAVDVVASPLGDKAGTWTQAQLERGYSFGAVEDTTTEKPTGVNIQAIYDVNVAHPSLPKHQNGAGVSGQWIGIGIPIHQKGWKVGTEDTPGKNETGSSFIAFTSTKNITDAVNYFKDKNWAGNGTPGFSEYGWRSDGTYLYQWYDVSEDRYKTATPYLVERYKADENATGYTYVVYRINFNVTEGHRLTITSPTNGTLTVKSGNQTVPNGYPVGENATLTLIPTPAAHYEVDKVKVGSEEITANEAGAYTTTVRNENLTVSATFKKIQRTVTFNANGGKFDTNAPTKDITVEDGEKVIQSNIPAPTNTDDTKVFVGWNTDKNATTTTDVTATTVTGNVTYYAIWKDKVDTGISVGFAWNGDDANTAINADIKTAGKTHTVTDSIDQTYWLLVNSDVTASNTKYTCEFKLGDTLLQDYTITGASGKIGVVYDSFLTRENAGGSKFTVKAGDVLTFNLYAGENKTGDLVAHETFTVPANPLTISSAGVTNFGDGTINVKFNNDLIGRYVVEVKKGDETVAAANTDCDRGRDDAGKIAQATGIDLTANAALTVGTYTVTIRPNVDGAAVIASKNFDISADITSITTTHDTVSVEADNTAHKIKLSGQFIDNPGSPPITVPVVITTKHGTLAEQSITVAYNASGDPRFSCTDEVTIYGQKYTVDVSGLKVITTQTQIVAPAAKAETSDTVKNILNNSTVDDGVKMEINTAVTAIEKTTPPSDTNTLKQLKDNAKAESASFTVNQVEALKNEAVKPENVGDIKVTNSEGQEVAPTSDDVVLVTQSNLVVTVDNYEKDEDTGAVTLSLDVSNEVRTVAYFKNDGETFNAASTEIKVKGDSGVGADANAVVVKKAETKPVSQSVTFTVTVPSSLITAGDPVWVKHDKGSAHYHEATTAAGAAGFTVLTITSNDGLSPFIIDTAATVVATVDGKGYETLQKAVDAVADGGTITVVGNASGETIKVSKDFTLTNAAGGTLPGTEKFVAASGYEAPTAILSDDGSTITVTAGDKKGGGTPGNGGGGSSATVSVPSTSNGKVSVNNTNAKKGDTVTITVTPNTGYEVGSVTVKDADGNTVDVVKVNDTQYTFVMPDGKVTVDATFNQVQQPSDEPFVDISKSDYFYDAVLWAVEKGITTGDGVNTFGPNKSCTRAQMVTFLWRAAGSPAATGSNPFVDVPAGEYYTDAVLWAVSQGITNGTGADTFSPSYTVTRGQTVTFLYRYAGSPAVSDGESFGDVASTDYFADAVQWAVANGITYGDGVNTFSPAKDCTRGQIVTFMYRQMAE